VGTALEQLAALAEDLTPEDLPPDVVREARRRLLDGIGCMLGGVRNGPVQSVFDAVGGPHGQATLVGDSRRASTADAALANATALRFLDFMDGHPGPYSCHPSLVIPAVLAAAEHGDASGAEVVRAIVLGYELDIRLQIASGDPDITVHGWSGSTNLGLAVPLAIGRMLGLTESQVAHALAIATVHSPTLDASGRGQMAASKSSVDGMVAMSSVTATLLARHGLTGKLSAYEGEDGFVEALAKAYDAEILLAPFDRFRILDAYTKYFNAVKCGQSAASAMLEIRPRLGSLQDVERITVRLAARDWRNQLKDESSRRRPTNRDTANHSAVYCVAAALVEGDLQSEQFGPRQLADPAIHDIINKITLETTDELTAYWPKANPAHIEVVTTSGEVLTATCIHSPGHPGNPLTDEQMETKFRALAAPMLQADRIDQIIDQVWSLETLPSIAPLMALLGAPVEGV
jgi:2-methylcitrate dehydratase